MNAISSCVKPGPLSKSSIEMYISRSQQRVFAATLYLVGGNRETAFEIAADALAGAARSANVSDGYRDFLATAMRIAVSSARDADVMPAFSEEDLEDFSPEMKVILGVLRAALLKLSFDDRSLVLLRNQLHMPYDDMTGALGVPAKGIKAATSRAQANLRSEVEGLISHAR